MMGMIRSLFRTGRPTPSSPHDRFQLAAVHGLSQTITPLDQAEDPDPSPRQDAGTDRDELRTWAGHLLQSPSRSPYDAGRGPLPGLPETSPPAALRLRDDKQSMDHGSHRHAQRVYRQSPDGAGPRVGSFKDPMGLHRLEKFRHPPRGGGSLSHAESDPCALSSGRISFEPPGVSCRVFRDAEAFEAPAQDPSASASHAAPPHSGPAPPRLQGESPWTCASS